MPERSKRAQSRPRDVNQRAFQIVQEATSQAPKYDPTAPDVTKNPHAVALGRLGGQKCRPARAAKLSPRKRSQIAAKAAKARWQKK